MELAGREDITKILKKAYKPRKKLLRLRTAWFYGRWVHGMEKCGEDIQRLGRPQKLVNKYSDSNIEDCPGTNDSGVKVLGSRERNTPNL